MVCTCCNDELVAVGDGCGICTVGGASTSSGEGAVEDDAAAAAAAADAVSVAAAADLAPTVDMRRWCTPEAVPGALLARMG